MTVYAITDTKKGRTGIAPTYLQTTQIDVCFALLYFVHSTSLCIFVCHSNAGTGNIYKRDITRPERWNNNSSQPHRTARAAL